MYKILLEAHSGIRYVVLLLLIAVLVKSLEGWMNRTPFRNIDDKLSLFFFISVHIQLLVGLALYFISPRVLFNHGFSDPMNRYWTAEHITGNIIAVALFTLGRIRSKKELLSEFKQRTLFIWTGVGTLVLIGTLYASQYGPGLLGSSINQR